MAAPRIINLDEQARLGSLTTPIIADGAIIGDKLAPDAVSASAIVDGGVTALKLNADVFGAGVIANPATNAIDLHVDDATLEISSNIVQVKVNGINQTHISLTGNISFGNYEIKDFRVENVSVDPTPGNAGRLVWRTDVSQLKVDTGASFTSIGSGSGGHIIEDEGVDLPQRATLNFTGAGVTASDDGTKTVVNIPSGGGTGNYAKALYTVVNPLDKTFSLANTPISNSEIVSWNGLLLKPGGSNDYTISGSTVTLNSGVSLTVGDELLIVYAY